MSTWLFFALLSPFLWAVTNVLDGAIRHHFVQDDFALAWWIAVTRLPFIILLLVLGNFDFSFQLSDMLWMLFGGVFWVAPGILYFRSIHLEDPTRVALMFQIIPIFGLTLSYFILGETLTSVQAIAFVILMLGGILAALKRIDKKWHISSAFFLMILATFLWSVSDVIFKKYEPAFANFYTAFAIYFTGSFFASFFFAHTPKKIRHLIQAFHVPLRGWAFLVMTQLLGISGALTFAYALTLGKVSLTVVLIGTQPLFVFTFGLFLSRFLKEVKPEPMTKRILFFKGLSFALVMLGLWML
ncbi:hypothetical protein COY07_02160 [Candidatus Peregrinibacteria bacterium CG_4_10_14_0_2_um_filter_43_11]|nr:MAG: hypothetical protein COY07_02160 [Candidatus Peregrinibacteria bacterium CG_4_10_14_0_2_um_filter_43_11]